MNIADHLNNVANGGRFFDREEIKAAKRKLSLPALMRLIGDGAFATEIGTNSPFHPSERPTFRLHRPYRRIAFSCCEKCGYEGDQVDYVKARYKLTTGQAIALFCNLAGIR